MGWYICKTLTSKAKWKMRKTQCPYLSLNFGCMRSYTAPHSILAPNAAQYLRRKSQQSLPRIPPQKNIDIQHSLRGLQSNDSYCGSKVHNLTALTSYRGVESSKNGFKSPKIFFQLWEAVKWDQVWPTKTRYTTTVPGVVKLAIWDATNKPGLYQVHCTWHHRCHNVRALKCDQVWTFVQLGHHSGNPCNLGQTLHFAHIDNPL